MSQVEKRFVDVLQGNRDPRPYVGITWNVSHRLDTHNRGGSVHTRPGRPWRLAAAIEFPTERRALDFEGYLKRPGRAGRS